MLDSFGAAVRRGALECARESPQGVLRDSNVSVCAPRSQERPVFHALIKESCSHSLAGWPVQIRRLSARRLSSVPIRSERFASGRSRDRPAWPGEASPRIAVNALID